MPYFIKDSNLLQPLNSLRLAESLQQALKSTGQGHILQAIWKHLRSTCQCLPPPPPAVFSHTSQAAEARIQPLRHSLGLAFPLGLYGAFQKQGQLFLTTAVQPESYSHRGLPPSSPTLVFRSDLVKSLCP